MNQNSGLSESDEVSTDPDPPVRETIIWVDVEIEHEGDNADQDSGLGGIAPDMRIMELDVEIEHERVKVDQDSELSEIAAEMEIMGFNVEIEYEGANVDQDSDLSELAAEMEVLELEAIKGGSARLSDPDPSSLVNNNEGRPQPGGHTKGLPAVISFFP